MHIIKNIPQKYLNVFYVFSALALYNGIILYRYFFVGQFTRDYIMAQYAFTYQEMGFVARGLLPSLLSYLSINMPIVYLYLFNFIIILYVIFVLYIFKVLDKKNYNYFVISFLFLFFGIPHFALDAFRLDILIMLFSLLVYISLKLNKNLVGLFLGIISLFIHEAVIFLIIPIYFLFFNNTNRKTLVLHISIYIFMFLCIIFLSNKTTEQNAIRLIQDFLNLKIVAKELYTLNVKESSRILFEMFNTYNLTLLIFFGLIYLVFILITFKNFFKNPIQIRKFSFLLPLCLCFLGVDYLRWYCFVFFLLLIFQIHLYKSFEFVKFRNLIFITLIIGIPISIESKFGLLHFLSKFF